MSRSEWAVWRPEGTIGASWGAHHSGRSHWQAERKGLGIMEHSITVDESADASDGGAIFAAFCTDSCGWKGEWQHADDFQDVSDDPADAARQAADDEGQAHLDEVAA